MDARQLKLAAKLIRASRKTIALTGAGVSTESGIPDFRSRGGLWSRFDPMEYGTIGAFRRNPEKVWRMLAELLAITRAEPNAGHLAMAAMERQGLLAGIITQNIDRLHGKAGSRVVVEFHGAIDTFSCLDCGKEFSLAFVLEGEVPPRCAACRTVLKPDIVFFDESIPDSALRQTAELIDGAELLIVAGASCQVAPASYIPHQVKRGGGEVIEINLEPALGGMADAVLASHFAGTMRELASALGAGGG